MDRWVSLSGGGTRPQRLPRVGRPGTRSGCLRICFRAEYSERAERADEREVEMTALQRKKLQAELKAIKEQIAALNRKKSQLEMLLSR